MSGSRSRSQGATGLEQANANLLGDVTLAWDDERTPARRSLATLRKAGFRESALRRE